MAKKKTKKKLTKVREHPMKVPVSEKNPAGITIRDQHLRRLPGTYLKRQDIEEILKATIEKTFHTLRRERFPSIKLQIIMMNSSRSGRTTSTPN